ncbi:MAG TPA: 6-pyruvoyl tetrahydrobiopterin synthase [Bacteroidales bacterium]|jgi:6-pyruvoyltetrahydropterin/6-carboxytetrahydropterin synthase|nr:6-pyruvoyl tetrahydrobiopterin synthase [Bacteroidales bacterium]HBZ22545.1 6-pyruvoyl tetrahydrobiopterin synthase [Bacteroidales bacterium]
MIYITRKEQFSAAHRMYREEWSDEENLRVFGKCSNPNWHGHNYILYVTVKGEISEKLGLFINLTSLKQIIKEKIIDKVDHKNLNVEVGFMHGKVATTENLAISIWNELKPAVEKEGAFLHCIRISETENNTIEYYG